VVDPVDDAVATPAGYIRQLKSSYPPAERNTATVPPVLKEVYNGDEESARKAIEAVHDLDYAHELLTRLMPSLPEVFSGLLEKGIVAVGEVNSPEPNATTTRLNGSTYAVVFNAGLPRFLYRVTRVLSTRFNCQGAEGASESLSFEESCRILTDVFFWYRETGQAYGPDYPVSKLQFTIASMLATEAETFFLAHELGHVFNDLRALAKRVTPEERAVAWADEAEADRFALSALIDSRNREKSPAPVEISYAGAEIALSTFAALEVLGVQFGRTHPPAKTRLDTIRNHLRLLCADEASVERATAFSKPLALLFSRIVGQLRAPDWESFLDRATAGVMNDLDRLLDQCTGGIVPDYSGFRANMPNLFDRLSSHRLYVRVAHATAEFARHMKEMGEKGKKGATRDAWVSFQKYKLFISMTGDLNEPFKSLLEEALRITT
jgi:hypothetical protein